MTKWILAAGAAALAITSPVLAERGGQGGDKGKGGQQAAKADKGGGGGNHGAKADHGGGNQAVKVDRGGRQERSAGNSRRRIGRSRQGSRRGQGSRQRRRSARGKIARLATIVNVRNVRLDDDDRFDGRFAGTGLINGCPPGLAKKLNGCMPPGQAKKLIGTRWGDPLTRSLLPASYRNWYPDNDDYLYRMRDGYVYRIDRDRGLINGLFPMFENDGNFFTIGQRYPLDYGFYNVPMQYRSFYADNDDYLYRYGDGGIYQVNRSSGLIEGIAALLAGDFGVGQPMPLGYDVYNVPLGYRDQYYDTADNWYRYNDGYIYQVDPRTQLIQAVISALI